jgi:hypothetical protein
MATTTPPIAGTARDHDGPSGALGAGRPGPVCAADPSVPLAGRALLDRLRDRGRARPSVDPALAADLAAAVERGLADLGLGPGRLPGLEQRLALEWAPGTPDPLADLPTAGAHGRLVLTPDRLRRALLCAGHRDEAGSGDRAWSVPLACGALVDALFRQLVTTGTMGDPMEDGLAALAVDDYQAPLAAWITGLPAEELGGLAAEVRRQAAGLQARWPALDPAWLPRTKEVLRAGLAGGAVELVARVDLVVGRPADDIASVALVEVVSGPRRPEHRADLHLEALIETVRTGAAPFAVSTYYTQLGELDVDPVTPELLVAAARRLLAAVGALVAQALGRHPAGSDGGLGSSAAGSGCPRCASEPTTGVLLPAPRPAPTATVPGASGEPADPGAPGLPSADGAAAAVVRPWGAAA